MPFQKQQFAIYKSVHPPLLKREGKNGDSLNNDNFGAPAEGPGTAPVVNNAAEIILASL
jgi:hypothetical protein